MCSYKLVWCLYMLVDKIMMLGLAHGFACSSRARSACEKTCSLHPYSKYNQTQLESNMENVFWKVKGLKWETDPDHDSNGCHSNNVDMYCNKCNTLDSFKLWFFYYCSCFDLPCHFLLVLRSFSNKVKDMWE